jgi:predicted MFS family arabinose efflux permease
MVDGITPEAMRGSYYGAHSLCNIGNFIGPWFGGWILASYSGAHLFVTMSIGAILSMLIFMFGLRVQQKQAAAMKIASLETV